MRKNKIKMEEEKTGIQEDACTYCVTSALKVLPQQRGRVLYFAFTAVGMNINRSFMIYWSSLKNAI
jgi:hypothetical protein